MTDDKTSLAQTQNRDGISALIRVAAECHRKKWQFDSGERRLSVIDARNLVNIAFNELHRIGDMALKEKEALAALAPRNATQKQDRDHARDLSVLETLLASTCFGKEVCQFPPCSCASAVAALASGSDGNSKACCKSHGILLPCPICAHFEPAALAPGNGAINEIQSSDGANVGRDGKLLSEHSRTDGEISTTGCPLQKSPGQHEGRSQKGGASGQEADVEHCQMPGNGAVEVTCEPGPLNRELLAAPSPAALDPVTVEALIPRATGSDKNGGWRLDFKWLDKLRHDVEHATKFDVTLECVEEIVIRVEALIGQPASNGEPWKAILNFARCIPDNVEDGRGLAYAPFSKLPGTAASLTAGNFRALLASPSNPQETYDDSVSAEDVRGILGPLSSTNAVPSAFDLQVMKERDELRARIERMERDPADIWDEYCAEVPDPDGRSPQGAMAFALDLVTQTSTTSEGER
jgi:hypothetical protein